MKRQQFTKQNIGAFRAALQKALDIVAKECGVTFHVGNITYDSQSCKIGVKAANVLDGKAQVQEEIDFLRHAPRYGFKKEDLFRTFIGPHGHRCKITGFLPSRTKYPIQYLNCDSHKTFVTTVKYAKHALGIEERHLTSLEVTGG